jgi:hypothetical protein
MTERHFFDQSIIKVAFFFWASPMKSKAENQVPSRIGNGMYTHHEAQHQAIQISANDT